MSEINYTSIIQELNKGLNEKNAETIRAATLQLLADRKKSGEQIKEHYNNRVYNTYNGTQGITKYAKESIVREIIQNIIDCEYAGNQIRISIEFDDNLNAITFKYNENGFKISNLISFFSLEHTTKGSQNAGAFGIGAKGAILSAEKVIIHSCYIKDSELAVQSYFEVKSIKQSNKKTLEIADLKLHEIGADRTAGTELTLFLDNGLYEKVKYNLSDITGVSRNEKGKFLTPIDMAFASLKQQGKSIEIKVGHSDLYVMNYQNDSTIFKYNNESITFKVYVGEESGFSYLMPYRYETMPKFITHFQYNYFSTYELTGDLDGSHRPKFYINLPAIDKRSEHDPDVKYFITNDRKAIQENKKNDVERFILEDFRGIIKRFTNELIIKTDYYYYIVKFLFEFIEYKLGGNYSEIWIEMRRFFCDNLTFAHEDKKYPLAEMNKYAYNASHYKQAKTIEDASFLFMEKNVDFRRTKFDFIVSFRFILNGVMLPARLHDGNVSNEYIQNGIDTEYYYVRSSKYRASSLLDRILYALHYRNGNEILLMSAEKDECFTEATLKKLLEALVTDPKIYWEYDPEDHILTVGDKRYPFISVFELKNREIIYYCYCLDKLGPLFIYIRGLYVASLMGRNGKELSGPDRIRQYSDAGCSFDFEADSLLNVYLPNKYPYPKVPIEERIDISDIDYSELVAITGLTNYNLLTDKRFDSFVLEQSIADKYHFDIEKIMKTFDNPLIHADTANIFNKIMMCSTQLNLGDKDLVAFVESNRIMRIVQLDQAIGRDFAVSSDFIAVIPHKNRDGKHAKMNIAKVAKFVDGLLSTGDTVHRLYKPVKLPIVKMIDQFDFKLKPILTVHQDEIETLRQYLKKIDPRNKIVFAKDLNNRLYGYSTSCSVCNYQSNILNAFQVKSDMKYQEYNLTLYLCANHYFESEGWIISKVKFRDAQKEYTISMENWIKIIAELNRIKAHMLKCEIEIIKKSTYKAFSFDNYEDDSQKAEFELHRIVLTPLMAVKWFEDNRRLVGV